MTSEMLGCFVACLLCASAQADNLKVLSVKEWQGKYEPKNKGDEIVTWGNDITTATTATVGGAYVDQLVYGWAIFRIHVHPSYFPFYCEITKSVCMYGNSGCNNLTTRMLFQGDATYNDDKSFNSSYVYKAEGKYPTTSHVYMDDCGGPQYNAHGNGTVTVTKRGK